MPTSEAITADTSRLLLTAARFPWSAPTVLAGIAGTSGEAMAQATQALADQGLLLSVGQAHSSYPPTHMALTDAGYGAAAAALSIPASVLLKRLHLTPGRYWALRAALEFAHELRTILDATIRDLKTSGLFTSLAYDLLLPRIYKSAEIHLHASLTLFDADRAYPYFLLLDRGDASAWQWYPQLRCLARMARPSRAPSYFPPLLIVSTRDFRARAMLALARMAGPAMTVAATAQREVALNDGLLAVTRDRGWLSMKADARLATVDPFAVPGMAHADYRRCRFAVRTLDDLRAPASTKTGSAAIPIALARPASLKGLEHLEALTDAPYRLLTFLVRHPVIPLTAVATFLDQSPEAVQRDLDTLEQHSLAERVPAPRRIGESIWAATDLGLRLRLAREMQPPHALKRYRFHRRDAQRHLFHTLAEHRFFEALKTRCDARSRSTRKLDTLPGALNTGHIPYYELAVFESEVLAGDWYIKNGQARHWHPDGYGALRAGVVYTRFWLEIDGTVQAPSRKDPVVWAGKMGRLCDYIESGRWALRYPHVPRLLIVTTAVVNRKPVYDALVTSARTRRLEELPVVYLAWTKDAQQRGPLGRIWHHVSGMGATGGRDDLCYAFEGVAPLAVRAHQPDEASAV